MEQNFSDRLREGLASAGRSQSELAEHLQVDRRKVNDWCRGKGTPGPEVIAQITRYLNMESDYLLDGSGSLIRQLQPIVSEPENHYSPYCLLPVVSKICKDIYDPANEIRRELCDKLTVKSEWFFLQMPDDHCNTGGTKCVKKGDLLLINPVIEDLYPGDLIAIATRSDRQWVRFIQNIGDIAVQLVGGIIIKREDIAAMYRVIRVRPAEFGV